jgi:pyruvate kinase
MEYDIIATLGPATRSQASWRDLLYAGATGFRLNTSHMSPDELTEWLTTLNTFRAATAPELPIILDLQGSKWRLGDLEARELHTGQQVVLLLADSAAGEDLLPVPHPDFFQAAPLSGTVITLNDAKVQLTIQRIEEEHISAIVTCGGPVAPRKGVTYQASTFRQERLNPRDRQIVAETQHMQGIHCAISYVRDALEMQKYRALVGGGRHLIAKLERQPAVNEARKIAHFADALWLCRGDLGAEMGLQGMAQTAAAFSEQVASLPQPVLLAGQVLEHMVDHPTPTRSEVACIYEALRRGFAGVVLSDETAVGRYPTLAVEAAAIFRTEDRPT